MTVNQFQPVWRRDDVFSGGPCFDQTTLGTGWASADARAGSTVIVAERSAAISVRVNWPSNLLKMNVGTGSSANSERR